MHNRDDFLVSIEDLDYLEGLLGDRAKIYPYGGHMGNIWYWQNRNDIVSIFGCLSNSNESKRIEDIVTKACRSQINGRKGPFSSTLSRMSEPYG